MRSAVSRLVAICLLLGAVAAWVGLEATNDSSSFLITLALIRHEPRYVEYMGQVRRETGKE
jgi:hypothetical protein